MLVRAMTIGDYVNVYKLWMTTPGLGLNSIDDSESGIRKYLDRNPSTCFVAEENEDIIGVIMAGHDGRRGFIYHMAVDTNRQRQGIGESLLSHALSALKSEGIHKVALVALDTNHIGNRFWEKQGFIHRPDLVYRNFALREIENIYT